MLMLVACEAMRGHLVGPERTGDMELVELEDRFVLRFDPCGSGGRTVRGDWIEGTPPRMQPPYDWTVVEEPYTWTHYKSGVCLYCVHCIVLMEEMPIDRFGYPVRVIDPPIVHPTRTAIRRRARSASGRCSRTRPRSPRRTTPASAARSRRSSGPRRRAPGSCRSSTSGCPAPADHDLHPTFPGAPPNSSSAAPHFFVIRLLPSDDGGSARTVAAHDRLIDVDAQPGAGRRDDPAVDLFDRTSDEFVLHR